MSRRRAHELGRDMRSTSTQDLPRLRALARTRARRRRGGSSPTTWVRLELSPTNRPGDKTSITWTAAMASAYANARGIMLASASTTRYAQYFLTASLEDRWLRHQLEQRNPVSRRLILTRRPSTVCPLRDQSWRALVAALAFATTAFRRQNA